MKSKQLPISILKNPFVWVGAGTISVLLVPLIAMQFTNEVKWTLSDFIVMGILLFSAGSLFVLLARAFPKQRIVVGMLVLLTFLYLWAELAVGIFTHLGS